MTWLPRAWPRPLLTAASIGAGGGAFLCGALGGASGGLARAGLLTGGVLLTMVAAWLASEARARGVRARQAAEEVALDAQQDLALTLNDALAPITGYLAALSAGRDQAQRRPLVGQLIQAVVDAAVRLSAADARCTFWRLSSNGRALVQAAYAGRSQAPRTRFVAGTPDGDFVLDLVQRGEFVVVDDVSDDPLVTPSTTGYASVVAVAVRAGERRLGLLTVDAPEPGVLGESDKEFVRVLANLLAAGLAWT